MQPSINRIKASDGTGNASVATVQAVRSAGATTIQVDTTQGIPTEFVGSMGTPHTFTDPVTGEEITIISEATAVDFSGHIDGSDLEIDDIAPGYTDGGSEVGDIVIIRPTTQWSDNLYRVVAEKAVNPVGMIAPYAGSSAPDNWLLCDGSAVSRTDYADLFTVIGDDFGAGDGSTTFNVPDLRSRLPIGVGTGTWSFSFAAGDVTTGTDQITVTASDNFQLGRVIQLTNSGGALPTGLSAATNYYIIPVDSTHIKLASSLANALLGTAVDITAQGSGTNTGTGTLSARTLAEVGGRETHTHSLDSAGSNESSAYALINLSANTVIYNRRDDSTWNPTQKIAPTGSYTSDGTNQTRSTRLGGRSNQETLLPPFLGLNYIIKT